MEPAMRATAPESGMSARPSPLLRVMRCLAGAALLALLATPLHAQEPPPPLPPVERALIVAPAPPQAAPLYNPPIEPAATGGSFNFSWSGGSGGHGAHSGGHHSSGGGHMHGSGGGRAAGIFAA